MAKPKKVKSAQGKLRGSKAAKAKHSNAKAAQAKLSGAKAAKAKPVEHASPARKTSPGQVRRRKSAPKASEAKPKPAAPVALGEVHALRVDAEGPGGRLDKVASGLIAGVSRSRVQRAVDLGLVRVNGEVANRRTVVAPGDAIEVTLPAPDAPSVEARKVPLRVLYEDAHLVVVDKPAGLITHPVTGADETSVVHALLHHTKGRLAPAGGTIRPGIVHRLDRETSGAMVVAKTDAAFHSLIAQFAGREPEKEYLALVDKCPRLLSGTLSASIDRHRTVRVRMAVRDDGREAVTDWVVESRFGPQAALIRALPRTGRTHQIRVHLAHLGHPILGDRTYGKFDQPAFAGWPMPRVMLHAHRLRLTHPATGKPMTFEAPVPADFRNLEAWLTKAYGRRDFAAQA